MTGSIGSAEGGSFGQFAALDIKVGALENDIGDVSTRLDNLDAKFEKIMASFAGEFRAAIAALSTQLSERNKTPWGILISGAGVVLTVVALVGHQAMSPIQDDINRISREVVPRKEVETRYSYTDARLELIRRDIDVLKQHEYDRLIELLKELREQNNSLKGSVVPQSMR